MGLALPARKKCPSSRPYAARTRAQNKIPFCQPLLVRTIRRELLFGHALSRPSKRRALGSGMLCARAIRTASLARALLTSRARLHAQMLATSSPPPLAACMTRSATTVSSRTRLMACARACSCVRSQCESVPMRVSSQSRVRADCFGRRGVR